MSDTTPTAPTETDPNATDNAAGAADNFADGGIGGARATAAAKAGWAGVLCGEQASGSQEEEDRKR